MLSRTLRSSGELSEALTDHESTRTSHTDLRPGGSLTDDMGAGKSKPRNVVGRTSYKAVLLGRMKGQPSPSSK